LNVVLVPYHPLLLTLRLVSISPIDGTRELSNEIGRCFV
jgi:hypothetical protein